MTAWTPAGIALLEQLWPTGASAGRIAKALQETGMVHSRNSVIGKAHRLGLAARPSPIGGMPGTAAKRPYKRKTNYIAVRRRVALSLAPMRNIVPPSNRRVPRSHNGCQWISGDPTHDDSCKCGAPRMRDDLPYCADHDAIAFNRREKNA